jgi:hypothetical protein
VNEQEIQSIAELFTLIETNKEMLKLETYSLSQTSLEQVFLSFARHQKTLDDDNDNNENSPPNSSAQSNMIAQAPANNQNTTYVQPANAAKP